MNQQTREERNAEMTRRFVAGETVADLAIAFRLTRRAVRFIVAPVMGPRVAERRAAIAARNADILRRLRAGESVERIAESVGMKRNSMYWACRRAGATVSDFPGHRSHGRRRNPERNRAIVDDIVSGNKPLAVASKFGLGIARVKAIAKQSRVNLRECRSAREEAARQAAAKLKRFAEDNAEAYLERAVARECAPPWERHPQPIS